jgi:hypothetical protein
LHRFRNFQSRILFLLGFLLAGILHGHTFSPRQQPPAATPLVETSVDYEPVKPGREFRITAKLPDRSKQLQKDLLCDVVG